MNTQTYNVQEDEEHLARLSSVEKRPQKILFGVLKGKVKVSDDFDAPLPKSVLAEFEGNECDF